MYQWKSIPKQEQEDRKNLQAVWEEDLLMEGVNKYWNDFNRSPDEGEPEQQLLDASVIHLQPLYQVWIDEAVKRKRTPRWLIPLLSIGSFKAADLVIRNILKITLDGSRDRGLTSLVGGARAQTLASDVAEDVINIVSYQASKEQFKDDWRKQSKFTKNWSPKRCLAFTKKLGDIPSIDRKGKQDFGHALVRIALLSDIVVAERVKINSWSKKPNKENIFVRLNDDILRELHRKHHLLELSSLIYRPMIAPPVDHLIDEPGGNYLRWLRKPTVKRYVNNSRDDEDRIKHHCSDLVLKGVNALQNTEWTINPKVLGVMENFFKGNTCLANLPSHDFEGFNIREYPKEGTKIDQAKWMAEREETWGKWYREEQKRCRMLVRLHLAKKLMPYDWFYHPYSLDFRGRAYTACELLSPQGADFDKGLLLFKTPKKQTDRGLYWLKVHTANLFDQDKDTYDSRVKWVDDNLQMLLDIAEDPYEHREWISDKEKKNPSFQRLAACIELARKDGLTQLPVQLDGACNGSQHWSVIMGDEIVAGLTNVTSSDKPQDLYGYIAQQTNDIITENKDGLDWFVSFMDHWQEGIERAVVKRPTMCDAYGLTFYGIQKYLKLEGHLDWVPRENRSGAVVEMARAVQEGLGTTLSMPNQGKDWLKEVAGVANAAEKHLIWTTPSGFIVEHVYQPIRQRRSYTELFNKKKFELVFANFYDGVNCHGQELGIAPNYIHSLDAAHMFLTLIRLLAKGIDSFSMIHDSYGVHAPDIDTMNECLRLAFIETHKENVLETFKQDVEKYLGLPTPPIPNGSGRIDPARVLDSEYFFS
jgi:DNA-directed RNA polymerase